MVGLLEFVKVALDGGVDAFDEFDFGEAAGRAVDCLDEGAVDGNEFFAEEAQLKTNQIEFPEDAFESGGMVLAEITDSAVVRAQIAGQPDRLEILGAGVFQTTAGAGALEAAPKVEFEEGAGMIGTAALREVAAGFEPESGQIKTIDEGINGSHRAGRRDIVVNRRRQEHGLATVGSCDVLRHARKFGFPN